jgi:hypothetical protein
MNWVRFPRGPPCIARRNNMEDDVVDTLREIVRVAQDESFSSDEALDVIMVLAEDVLSRYGHSVDSEIDED